MSHTDQNQARLFSFVVRLVALPLCALVAAGMWHFYRRAYNRGAFDVFVASYPTSAANRII